ncbi:MAG: hypothetical protein HQL49_03035 [Gammaproteobacteria bacterium]|nr:hypothetical protein [Gammaproteobacteria bacterium]
MNVVHRFSLVVAFAATLFTATALSAAGLSCDDLDETVSAIDSVAYYLDSLSAAQVAGHRDLASSMEKMTKSLQAAAQVEGQKGLSSAVKDLHANWRSQKSWSSAAWSEFKKSFDNVINIFERIERNEC